MPFLATLELTFFIASSSMSASMITCSSINRPHGDLLLALCLFSPWNQGVLVSAQDGNVLVSVRDLSANIKGPKGW